MGIYILAFVDTDLHDMDATTFKTSLEKRLGLPVFLQGWENSKYESYMVEREDWILNCENRTLTEAMKNRALTLLRLKQDCKFGLDYYSKTWNVDEFEVDGNCSCIVDGKFTNLCYGFNEWPDEYIPGFKNTVEMFIKYIVPITHATRLLLIGDEGYENIEEYLFAGHSIDEALELNKNSKSPRKVYTWDNLNELKKDDAETGIFDIDLVHPKFEVLD